MFLFGFHCCLNLNRFITVSDKKKEIYNWNQYLVYDSITPALTIIEIENPRVFYGHKLKEY